MPRHQDTPEHDFLGTREFSEGRREAGTEAQAAGRAGGAPTPAFPRPHSQPLQQLPEDAEISRFFFFLLTSRPVSSLLLESP